MNKVYTLSLDFKATKNSPSNALLNCEMNKMQQVFE